MTAAQPNRQKAKAPAAGSALSDALVWFHTINFRDKSTLLACYNLEPDNLTRLKNGGVGVSRGQQKTYAKYLLRLCLAQPDTAWSQGYERCQDHASMQAAGDFGQLAEAIYDEFPELHWDKLGKLPPYQPMFYPDHEARLWDFSVSLEQDRVALLSTWFGEISKEDGSDSITVKVGRVFVRLDCATTFSGAANASHLNDMGQRYLLRQEGLAPNLVWNLGPVAGGTYSLDGRIGPLEICTFKDTPNQGDYFEITTKTANLDVTSTARGELRGPERAAAFRQFLLNRVISLKSESPIRIFRVSLGGMSDEQKPL